MVVEGYYNPKLQNVAGFSWCFAPVGCQRRTGVLGRNEFLGSLTVELEGFKG